LIQKISYHLNQATLDREYIDLYDDTDSLIVNGEVVIVENWKVIAKPTIGG
jgi:hypothetical protein